MYARRSSGSEPRSGSSSASGSARAIARSWVSATGAVIVADVRGDRRPPRPGESTASVLVRVEDARAHCAQAREHGARIVMELTDFEYGERQYHAEDPAGHQWTFSETLADTAPEEWGGETISPR